MKKFIIAIAVIILVCVGCSSSTAGYKYESARLQYTQKNYKEALGYIQEAIKTDSKQEYYILEGQILHKLGRYEEAIESYKRVNAGGDGKRVLENNKQAFKYIALSYMDMGAYDEAYTYIEESQSVDVLHEIDEELLLYKMDIAYGKEDYASVVKQADAFIKKYELSENLSHAYIIAARAYCACNKLEEAQKYYNKAVEMKDYTSYYYMATSYELLGLYKEAYDYYEKFIKHSDSDIKYEIYAKQVDCAFKLLDRELSDENFKLAEDKITAGMVAKDKQHLKIFAKKYIAFLEKKGMYEEAFVYAQEYMVQYPEDKAVEKEIKFLETRIQ